MNTSTTTRERITIDDPPERLLDLVAWARNTVESVPEEHRAGATIELVTEDGYSGPETRIEVRFTRPATVKSIVLNVGDQRASTGNVEQLRSTTDGKRGKISCY